MSGMERFTQRAKQVLSLAHEEAERMRQGTIGTEHLLLGLMKEEGGVAGRVLRELGLEAERVEEVIIRLTGAGQDRSSRLELSPGTQKALGAGGGRGLEDGPSLHRHRAYPAGAGGIGRRGGH